MNINAKRMSILANGAMRKLIVQVPTFNANKIIVNEFPKCGGTWLASMISDYLNLPFPRNTLPHFGSSVMHGHYMSCRSSKRNRIVLWRDGRDVMVSWYYHSLFKNDLHNHALVDHVESDLNFTDKNDIKSNLPAFIEYCYQRQTIPRFTWSQFVQKWGADDSVIHTSYEKLRKDPSGELSEIIGSLTSDSLDLNRINTIVENRKFKGSSSSAKSNHSFQRKGIVGDWKNSFSEDAISAFKRHAGDELVMLGYEKDKNWSI